jgi:hypothetical protein
MKLHFIKSPIPLIPHVNMLALCEKLVENAEFQMDDILLPGGDLKQFLDSRNSLSDCRLCLLKLAEMPAERAYLYGIVSARKSNAA